MSNKPVEVPKVGFNEALQRIAKFSKDDLPVETKPKKNDAVATKPQVDVKTPNKTHK